MSYEKPFDGIRILDLSQGIAGPYCASLLAQWGAEVIKVEPLEGDWSRSLGPAYGDHTAFSITGNLGKRSLAVDLKAEAGREAVARLAAKADLFMEGFRPGVIDRLGFGYEAVRALAPGIVYLSISGYGQSGPLREKPAMDPILQAYTGFMANNGNSGEPQRALPIIVDMTTALYAYQAVAAALYARRDDPRPRFIDASLMAGAANLQAVRLMSTDLEGRAPPPGLTPGGIFPCREGHLQIVVSREKNWQALCDLLDLADLRDQPDLQNNNGRIARIEELNARVSTALAARSAREWSPLFTEAGIQNEPVLTYFEFLEEPQVAAAGVIARLPQPDVPKDVAMPVPPGIGPLQPGEPRAVAPRLGADSRAVLGEAGYAAGEIDRLISDGVVVQAATG